MPRDRADAEILGSIAGNVYRRRHRLKLTQEELAEAAGLDVRAIQRIEQAVINFGVVTLVRLAAALKTSIAELARPAKFIPARPGRPTASKAARPLARARRDPTVAVVAETVSGGYRKSLGRAKRGRDRASRRRT